MCVCGGGGGGGRWGGGGERSGKTKCWVQNNSLDCFLVFCHALCFLVSNEVLLPCVVFSSVCVVESGQRKVSNAAAFRKANINQKR